MSRAENELVSVPPPPKDDLTPSETELVRAADQGELPCSRCGGAAAVEKITEDLPPAVADQVDGMIHFCLDIAGCGWREI